MALAELLATRLPMNRKERYFTGTVLPMIVACDGFAHLGRFLELVGLPDSVPVVAEPAQTNLQFFTEYGFLESLVGDARTRFPTLPTGKDTPDVVLYLDGSPGQLVALEAKMFDVPSAADLNTQVVVQRALLDGISDDLPLDVEVWHAALLPQALATAVGEIDARVVTWEQVLAAYDDVAPGYWLAVLREALGRYDELKGKGPVFGLNRDGQLTGSAIVDGYRRDQLIFTWMGRNRGLDGPELANDVATGGWRSQLYEVRREPLPGNRNWFPIEAFVAKIDAAG